MSDTLFLALVIIACATSSCAVSLLFLVGLVRKMVRTSPLVQESHRGVPAVPPR